VVFCVLRCFAVFCGCFAGVLWCSASGFWKTETVFCGVLRMFCNVLDVFCECFCRHFLSERKLHNTVLRCIAQTKRILFVLCVLYTFWSVLCCFVKNAKNTRTQNTAKHHKTPQNTAKHCFWKTSTILLRDSLRVRDPPLPPVIYAYIAYCVLSRQIQHIFEEYTISAQYVLRIAAVLRPFCDSFERFAFILRCFAT